MYYFNDLKSSDGCIYSLDMVRLNFDLGTSKNEFVNYINHINAYDLSYTIKYWASFKQYQYRHLWNVADEDKDVSWTIGLDLGRDGTDSTKGYIEFNPNKCENSVPFKKFWQCFKAYTVSRELVRYDLAIDIPKRRFLCKLIRTGKKNYEYIVKGDGVTEYSGVRNNNGFVKLYDKTIESDLNYDLTRLEITLDSTESVGNVFPTVWLYDEQIAISKLMVPKDNLSSTQVVLCRLIRESSNPNEYLQELKYDLRKKIEPYLADKVLSLDNKLASVIKAQALAYQ